MAVDTNGSGNWFGGILDSVIGIGTKWGEKELIGDDAREQAERSAEKASEVDLAKSRMTMQTILAISAIVVAGVGLIILIPRVLK